MGENPAAHTSYKRLVARRYKELKKLSNKM